MPEQIITKTCRVCKRTKPIFRFCKNAECKNGYYNWCKDCMQLYQKNYARSKKRRTKMKEYLQTPKGKEIITQTYKRYNQSEKGKIRIRRYSNRHPEKRRAKNAVNQVVSVGKLPRPDTLQCHYCPEKAEQYHHWHGYERKHWLDVEPVCCACHRLLHKKVAI